MEPAEDAHRISVYLRPNQVEYLDDLCYRGKKITGKRISANRVIRAAIDHFSSLTEETQIKLVNKEEP